MKLMVGTVHRWAEPWVWRRCCYHRPVSERCSLRFSTAVLAVLVAHLAAATCPCTATRTCPVTARASCHRCRRRPARRTLASSAFPPYLPPTTTQQRCVGATFDVFSIRKCYSWKMAAFKGNSVRLGCKFKFIFGKSLKWLALFFIVFLLVL